MTNSLTQRDLILYDRQIRLFGYKTQQKIKQLTINVFAYNDNFLAGEIIKNFALLGVTHMKMNKMAEKSFKKISVNSLNEINTEIRVEIVEYDNFGNDSLEIRSDDKLIDQTTPGDTDKLVEHDNFGNDSAEIRSDDKLIDQTTPGDTDKLVEHDNFGNDSLEIRSDDKIIDQTTPGDTDKLVEHDNFGNDSLEIRSDDKIIDQTTPGDTDKSVEYNKASNEDRAISNSDDDIKTVKTKDKRKVIQNVNLQNITVFVDACSKTKSQNTFYLCSSCFSFTKNTTHDCLIKSSSNKNLLECLLGSIFVQEIIKTLNNEQALFEYQIDI